MKEENERHFENLKQILLPLKDLLLWRFFVQTEEIADALFHTISQV